MNEYSPKSQPRDEEFEKGAGLVFSQSIDQEFEELDELGVHLPEYSARGESTL